MQGRATQRMHLDPTAWQIASAPHQPGPACLLQPLLPMQARVCIHPLVIASTGTVRANVPEKLLQIDLSKPTITCLAAIPFCVITNKHHSAKLPTLRRHQRLKATPLC